MANQVYNHFKMHLLSGDVDLAVDDVWLLLCSGTYAFSHEHELTGDITEEITSAGYTKGGMLIPNTVLTTGVGTAEGQLTGDNVTFSGLTATVEYGIVWVSGSSVGFTGSALTGMLLGQIDFGSQTLTSSDLVITWNADGIYNLT